MRTPGHLSVSVFGLLLALPYHGVAQDANDDPRPRVGGERTEPSRRKASGRSGDTRPDKAPGDATKAQRPDRGGSKHNHFGIEFSAISRTHYEESSVVAITI